MKFPVACEALQSGNFAAFRPKSRNKTTMDRFAIEPHRASSTIARVAPLFDVKPSEIGEGMFLSTGPVAALR